MSIAKIAYLFSCLALFSTGAMFSARRILLSELVDFQAPLPPIDPDADQDEALRCLWAERYWNETPDRQMRSDERIYRLCLKRIPAMILTVFEQRDKEKVVSKILAQSKIQEIDHEELAYESDGLLPQRLTDIEKARVLKAKARKAAKAKAKAKQSQGSACPVQKKSRARRTFR